MNNAKPKELNEYSIAIDIIQHLRRREMSWDDIVTRFSNNNRKNVEKVVSWLSSDNIIEMGYNQGELQHKWRLNIH